MFEISSQIHFSAAHHLINYDGDCENVHGHNWLVCATIRSNTLNDIGLGIDFKILKNMLTQVLDKLDHTDLNIIFNKKERNPSSENIARYIYQELEKTINEPNCIVYRIDVYETPGNCASYFEND